MRTIKLMSQLRLSRSIHKENIIPKGVIKHHLPVETSTLVKCQELVKLVRQYRELEEAYLAKVKTQEFNREEKHYMMKCRQKLDYLLQTINL